LPIELLKHNVVGDEKLSADEPLWGRAFRKRAKRSHLKHPLLVQQDADGKHHIMDGSHRLGKAIVKGHKHIPAYVFQHDQMPESTRVEETNLLRSPLLLERDKKLAFRGGVLNRHTPREGAWLPKKLRPAHKDGNFRRNPKGKQETRAGDPLRDEPLRHDIEKRAKNRHRHAHIHSDVSLDLARTELLLDHDKKT